MTSFVHYCFSTIVLLGLTFTLHSQENKDVTYDISGFTELDVSQAFSVIVNQGNTYKIEVSYPPELEGKIKIGSNGQTLKIGMSGARNIQKLPVANITMPTLDKLEVSGASSVVLNEFKGEKIHVEISGASSLKANLNYNAMVFEASGASDATLEGSINGTKAYFSGASRLSAKKLMIQGELILDCSGASSVTATVNGDMYVEMSGASSFNYAGEGNMSKAETSGASSISKID